MPYSYDKRTASENKDEKAEQAEEHFETLTGMCEAKLIQAPSRHTF